MFIYSMLNFVSFVVSLLGFRGIDCVAKTFGFVAFDVLRVRRSILLQNLDIVFKDSLTLSQKKAMARRSISSFVATMLEFIAAPHLFHKATVKLTGLDHLKKIMDQNLGAYSICLHMSNWEFLCHVGSKTIAPIHVVVKPIGKGNVARWIENVRTKMGFSLIDRKGNSSAASQIFKALQKKEVIGFIVDQKRPNGEHLPFFGKLASTNNSLVKLYLRKKAPILPCIIKRHKPGHFEVIYFSEFLIEEDKNLSINEIVTLNTLRMNQQVEKMILMNPQEYFWMHNRWDLKK